MGYQPSAAPASAASEGAQQSVGYPSLFGLVLLGSLVPVVPTGAVVSAAAVVAWHLTSPMNMLGVVLVGSAAGYLGDVVLYWIAARGERWLKRITRRVDPERLAWSKRKLERHRWSTLILSRLMPAGRIPVMVACILAGMPLRRFATGNIPAVLIWCVVYGVVGVGSGSLFPEPWQGVLAVCAVVMLISVIAPRLGGKLKHAPAASDDGAVSEG
ncbi:hypothetical protein BIV57_08235 [Mangrovactinospora gilvigrisea]|uniref:VTT domain-containing protein n=1 Tax=Mangrovactinospora gilvigrisea TaxID=1428644 RepID=A0A1J7BWX8_9ACTN|nr:VTT domain-containing protein [Mangrovactinospora gilvigrisea]OIV37977.1 hypothetical protein BIV57_08235 [Mangrovactinospora gilvigrisea]